MVFMFLMLGLNCHLRKKITSFKKSNRTNNRRTIESYYIGFEDRQNDGNSQYYDDVMDNTKNNNSKRMQKIKNTNTRMKKSANYANANLKHFNY